MVGVLSQSAGRRFIKKFGMALVWAALVGSVVSPLVYFRPARPLGDDDVSAGSFYLQPIRWLESLELWSYDWRMRELALASQRPEDVVVVAIDDETVANARQSEDPLVAVQPWPRALLGNLVHELLNEGAAQVVLDLDFADISPRSDPQNVTSDDDALRALLDERAGSTVVGFSFAPTNPPPISSQLRPWRVKLGEAPTIAAARPLLRRVLAQRLPAFVIPSGPALEIWAGVATEEEGSRLSHSFDLRGPAQVREFAAADRGNQWTALDLIVSLAEVEVPGANLEALPRMRTVEHPVPSLLTDKASYGASVPLRDVDGVVRAVPQLLRYTTPDGKEHVLPSLALATSMAYVGSRSLSLEKNVLTVGGKLSLPVDDSAATLVRFDAPEVTRDPRGTLKRSLSAWRVVVNYLDKKKGMPVHYDNGLKGRVVLLTNTVTVPETVPTAVGAMSGDAGLWGQAISNWLSSEGIRRAAPREDITFTYVLAFVGAFVALTFTGLVRSFFGAAVYVIIAIAGVVAFLAFARTQFVQHQVWIALAGPLLAMAATFTLTSFYAFRTERDVSDFITGVLGRYVSPEVARQVTRDLTLVRPERRQLTVYFADIDQFTQLSEKLPPQKLAQLLSEFFTATTDVIRGTAGQVDKYIGDAVMAFWGAPIRTEKHAAIACETALALQDALMKMQADWEKRFGAKLTFRAGLNTGECVVGDLGSFLKSTYTVLGQTVNLASALEKLNRKLGTRTLVGEETVKQAGDGFIFREVARLPRPNGAEAISVYELCCRKKELTPEREELLKAFAAALALYRKHDFAEAEKAFGALKDRDPASAVYAEKASTLAAHPELAVFDIGVGV